jgi:hypothetical protein
MPVESPAWSIKTVLGFISGDVNISSFLTRDLWWAAKHPVERFCQEECCGGFCVSDVAKSYDAFNVLDIVYRPQPFETGCLQFMGRKHHNPVDSFENVVTVTRQKNKTSWDYKELKDVKCNAKYTHNDIHLI